MYNILPRNLKLYCLEDCILNTDEHKIVNNVNIQI